MSEDLANGIYSFLHSQTAPLSSIDIARQMGFPSPKNVNPTLYRLHRKNCILKIVGDTTAPLWQVQPSQAALTPGDQPVDMTTSSNERAGIFDINFTSGATSQDQMMSQPTSLPVVIKADNDDQTDVVLADNDDQTDVVLIEDSDMPPLEPISDHAHVESNENENKEGILLSCTDTPAAHMVQPLPTQSCTDVPVPAVVPAVVQPLCPDTNLGPSMDSSAATNTDDTTPGTSAVKCELTEVQDEPAAESDLSSQYDRIHLNSVDDLDNIMETELNKSLSANDNTDSDTLSQVPLQSSQKNMAAAGGAIEKWDGNNGIIKHGINTEDMWDQSAQLMPKEEPLNISQPAAGVLEAVEDWGDNPASSETGGYPYPEDSGRPMVIRGHQHDRTIGASINNIKTNNATELQIVKHLQRLPNRVDTLAHIVQLVRLKKKKVPTATLH